MDVLLSEKTPIQRMSIGIKDTSYSQQEPFVSPTNRYGLGMNQISARNVTSARNQRASAHLAPLHILANNIETPKRLANAQVAVNNSANPGANVDRSEDLPLKALKHQPKISNSPYLPSVFSNEKPNSIKIK